MLAQNIMKLLQKYGVNFLNGLGTTLLLALISVSIGCVIGALVAILRLGKSKVLRAVATVYTEVIRDTPLLLQLYFFYFLLPDILPALKLSKFACITIALVINSGAYMSEVFRSGIQSIDRGKTYLVIEPLVIIGVIYFVVTFSMSKLITVLERRLKNDD